MTVLKIPAWSVTHILAKDAKGSRCVLSSKAGQWLGWLLPRIKLNYITSFYSDILKYLLPCIDSARLHFYLQPIFLNAQENNKGSLLNCFNIHMKLCKIFIGADFRCDAIMPLNFTQIWNEYQHQYVIRIISFQFNPNDTSFYWSIGVEPSFIPEVSNRKNTRYFIGAYWKIIWEKFKPFFSFLLRLDISKKLS